MKLEPTKKLLPLPLRKNVRIRSFSGRYFPALWLNMEICNPLFSIRKRENTDQKNSKYGHFLHSVPFTEKRWILFLQA